MYAKDTVEEKPTSPEASASAHHRVPQLCNLCEVTDNPVLLFPELSSGVESAFTDNCR